jgi:coproporphyrinogen III oxidase-like Fe-S oxidoreductase
MLDCLSLGLRLREGVSLSRFRERFGHDALALLGETGDWLLDTGVLRVQDDRLTLDAERQFVINEVLVRIDQAVRDTSSSHMPAR